MKYQVLHNFGKGSDGLYPDGALTRLGNAFYGTTGSGGATGSIGTVYRVSTSGEESVLHSFADISDGITPTGSLLYVNGTLYGTTAFGGGINRYNNGGTVFGITPTGEFHVLHRFQGDKPLDGKVPMGGVTSFKGKLYGTTSAGGEYGKGIVFSLTPGGAEHIVYSFGKNARDGQEPVAGLIDVGGTLYGTTAGGGTYGDGTVFSITPQGVERVLHSFGKWKLGVYYDGAVPESTLLNVDGTLYGTTAFIAGGNPGEPPRGQYSDGGTVFAITTDGAERVVALFNPGTNCYAPHGDLSSSGTTLFGVTDAGRGCVFSIDSAGMLQILYSAGKNADGIYPTAAPNVFNGVLYGTTAKGGQYARSGQGGGVFYTLALRKS